MDGMSTDRQYDGMLIEQYSMLMRIRESALSEGSEKTVAMIEKELNYLRLKLRPLSLPDEEKM